MEMICSQNEIYFKWLALDISNYLNNIDLFNTRISENLLEDNSEALKKILNYILPNHEPESQNLQTKNVVYETIKDIYYTLITHNSNKNLKENLEEWRKLFLPPATIETVFTVEQDFRTSLIEGCALSHCFPLFLHFKNIPPHTMRLFFSNHNLEDVKRICRNDILELNSCLQDMPTSYPYQNPLLIAAKIYSTSLQAGYFFLVHHLRQLSKKEERIQYIKQISSFKEGVLPEYAFSGALEFAKKLTPNQISCLYSELHTSFSPV